MPRRSLTISAMRVTGTRKAIAILFMLSRKGAINSSRRISPGWTGFSFLAIVVLLVVIDDLDLVSVPIAPGKANAPLVVDADAVLALAVALQALQSVSGQRRKRSQVRRRVEHIQLSKRLTCHGPEPPPGLPAAKAVGVGASAGPDHQ